MSRLDDILRRYTLDGEETAGKITGAAFVVTDKNGTIYTGSAGRLDLDPKSGPWTDKTLTWAASLTKLVTTVAIMQLVEKHRLSLDQDVRPLVPELQDARILRRFDEHDKPIYEVNNQPITLRQLLTHTSGASYEFSDSVVTKWARTMPDRDLSRIQWSRQEITNPLRFGPGEAWSYSAGLDWAGLLLETVTGTSLGQYMQANIFDRLGMTDTGFWPDHIPHAAARTAADTKRRTDFTLEPASSPTPEKHDLESGGAGLFTTAADFVCLLQAFLRATQHGTPYGSSIISAQTAREMLTPQLDEAQVRSLHRKVYNPSAHATFAPEFEVGQPLNYGLGGMLNTHDVPRKRRAGSIAWSGILNSRWWLDPKTGIAAVLIVNVQPNGDPVAAKLYDELERAVYAHVVGGRVRSYM
ncbi:hypothetical protein E4U32_000977 [Claviceps aff. humidiphila group G2b]|nr:hypothetical protein E4U32_000977 [Claviceps aff. humidiphila group G2b]